MAAESGANLIFHLLIPANSKFQVKKVSYRETNIYNGQGQSINERENVGRV